ncbi:MAG: hypothetical protein KJO91_12340, partial [Gammaproteobacteria bacterium]|nr:hypothetical protein [Gammaproteobacteria bacterium]
MAKKLHPSEKYCRAFKRKYDNLFETCNKKPTLGKGATCTNKAGGMTVAELFTNTYYQAQLEQNRQKREIQRYAKFIVGAQAIAESFNHIWQFDQTPEKLHRHARNVGNAIYDLPYQWTGYRTQAAIDSGEKVKEHFYPRQWAGYVIVNYIMEHKGFEDFGTLVDVLMVLAQVHYTTAKENQSLKGLQDAETFVDWHGPYVEKCS